MSSSATGYCENIDMIVVGMQSGERAANCLRFFAMIISLTVASRWTGSAIKQMPLLFFNWISSVAYVGIQSLMSLMVLNCWAHKSIEWFIFLLKFLEVYAVSCLPLSNFVIMYSLVRVIKGFTKSKRIEKVDSKVAVAVSLLLALGVAIASVVYWDSLLKTGGYFWVGGGEQPRWINISFTCVSTAMGIIMTIIIIEHIPRAASVIQCCRMSKTVYYYTILSVLAAVVNLLCGMASIMDEVEKSSQTRRWVMYTWVFRYIHIILNMFVLIRAMHTFEERSGTRFFASTSMKMPTNSTSTVTKGGSVMEGGSGRGSGGGGGGGGSDGTGEGEPRLTCCASTSSTGASLTHGGYSKQQGATSVTDNSTVGCMANSPIYTVGNEVDGELVVPV